MFRFFKSLSPVLQTRVRYPIIYNKAGFLWLSRSDGLIKRIKPPARLFGPVSNCSCSFSTSAPPGNEKQDESSQGSQQRRVWPLFLFAAAAATGALLSFNTFQKSSGGTITTFEEFILLLEKGEVMEIAVVTGNVAYIRLHKPVNTNNGLTAILALPLTSSEQEFEKAIRSYEDKWGIPVNDRIRIKNFEGVWNNPAMATVTLAVGSFLLSTLATIFIMAYLLKKGKLSKYFSMKLPNGTHVDPFGPFDPQIKNPPTPPPPPKDSPTGPKTSTSSSSTSTNSDADRFGAGMPFTWDPMSGFNQIKPVTTNVKFKDVAGLHASKQEVMEFVYFLKDPTKYQALGAKLPKGALLLGPPGTGKTLLVKALANEAGVPFYSMAGSEFVEIIGGLGASRMRQLFKAARSQSPAIIFIDELDSLGRRRSSSGPGSDRNFSGGGLSEMEQTLNQLLVEMDGMDTTAGVIVFAATNRADLLDRALLRAGRFDRHIYIDLPNLAERKELFAMYIGRYHLASNVLQEEVVERLASWTPGMSGADIARLCNEAALIAARREESNPGILKSDFEAAFERISVGSAKRTNPLSLPERHVAAVQEAGRALVAWMLPKTGLLPVKISIIPRTAIDSENPNSLGFTQLIPEDKHLFTTEELANRMAVLLGGRAAEQITFNTVSDASQRYLKKANELALKQVREWGMSQSIGNLSFDTESSGGEFGIKPFSQATQAKIEFEAQRLVVNAFKRCIDILEQNKEKLQCLVEALLKKETLTYDEIALLLGNDYKPSVKPRL